jgi:phosphoenolpyruvate synthase/pyruvate phosphate dikinase
VIAWLGEEAAHDELVVGGKAASLSRLAARFRVPSGFVATPESDASAIADAYQTLGGPQVAVRSSAVGEDGLEHSFAGQLETFLNIAGTEAVVDAVARCRASAESERVLEYLRARGLRQASVSVLVQELVEADVSAVAFSVNPITSDADEVVINASLGLGESIVAALVTPDEIVVSKSRRVVASYAVGTKERMVVAADDGTVELAVPVLLRNRPALSNEQAVEIASLAAELEESVGHPVDIECAYRSGILYLLQSRPITTLFY